MSADSGDRRDPLAFFGLGPEATDKDLKRAYARMIRQHRPDQDPEGFRRVQQAYELAWARLGCEWQEFPSEQDPDSLPVAEVGGAPTFTAEEVNELLQSRDFAALEQATSDTPALGQLFAEGLPGDDAQFRNLALAALLELDRPATLMAALEFIGSRSLLTAVLWERISRVRVGLESVEPSASQGRASQVLAGIAARTDIRFDRMRKAQMKFCLLTGILISLVAAGLSWSGWLDLGPLAIIAGFIAYQLLGALVSGWREDQRPYRALLLFGLARTGGSSSDLLAIARNERRPCEHVEFVLGTMKDEFLIDLASGLGAVALSAEGGARLLDVDELLRRGRTMTRTS